MSFNPDTDIRGSHTIRIFGTNKDRDVLQDIWLDLERIDIYYMTSESEGHDQGVFRKLYWMDDPQADDYAIEGNPARTEGTLKICSPDEEDQEDPEEWVPVRTIIETEFKETGGSHEEREATSWHGWRGNRTDGDNEVRLVEARRCFHRETIIDDEVDAATANDPDLKAYVVSSENYDFKTRDYNNPDDETKDEDTFIEVQYVSCTFDESTRAEDENKDQLVQTSWKNSHYLSFTDPAKGPANPNHGFDPPWALDPFQAIINVQWGGLAVEFGDKGKDAP